MVRLLAHPDRPADPIPRRAHRQRLRPGPDHHRPGRQPGRPGATVRRPVGHRAGVRRRPQRPGAGEARSRVRRAVERTVPFALLVHTLIVIWYARYGHGPGRCRRPPRRPALVPDQDRAGLRGHAHQAAPHDDRRPVFATPPWSARTRANPRRPRSLGRRHRITTKLQACLAHPQRAAAGGLAPRPNTGTTSVPSRQRRPPPRR